GSFWLTCSCSCSSSINTGRSLASPSTARMTCQFYARNPPVQSLRARRAIVADKLSPGRDGGEGITGNLVLIGAGQMGGALLEGWIALGVDPACITVLEPHPAASIEALSARGVRINPDLASIRPGAIVIAVKPQIAAEIMPSVASLMLPSTVVVSIM